MKPENSDGEMAEPESQPQAGIATPGHDTNCATPDCEYKATAGSAFCYCHSRGFNPPLTFEQYDAIRPEDLAAYRAKLRQLEKRAKN